MSHTHGQTGTPRLRKWVSDEHLRTEADVTLYLQACLLEAGADMAFIAKALGTIARAKPRHGFQMDADLRLGR